MVSAHVAPPISQETTGGHNDVHDFVHTQLGVFLKVVLARLNVRPAESDATLRWVGKIELVQRNHVIQSPSVGFAIVLPSHVGVELESQPRMHLETAASYLVDVYIPGPKLALDSHPVDKTSVLILESKPLVRQPTFTYDRVPSRMGVPPSVLASTVPALVEETVCGSPGHEVVRVVGFPLLALAALFLAVHDRVVEGHALADLPLAVLDL